MIATIKVRAATPADLVAAVQALVKDVYTLTAVLQSIEWRYPPADAVKSTSVPFAWIGAARCPVCFAEWTPAERHAASCALADSLLARP